MKKFFQKVKQLNFNSANNKFAERSLLVVSGVALAALGYSYSQMNLDIKNKVKCSNGNNPNLSDCITKFQQNGLIDALVTEDSDLLDLCVKQSQIANAGLGLFAVNAIAKDDIIVEFRGGIIAKGDQSQQQAIDKVLGDESRILDLNAKYLLLGYNLAGYANDIILFQPEAFLTPEYHKWIKDKQFPLIPGKSYNAEIKTRSNKAFLVALNEIAPNDEIYINYGFEYWQTFYQKFGLYYNWLNTIENNIKSKNQN